MAKIPVKERAIVERIRRVLRRDGRDLRAATSEQQKALGLGRYYTVGAKGIIDKDVDLEALGLELQALRTWETVKKEPS